MFQNFLIIAGNRNTAQTDAISSATAQPILKNNKKNNKKKESQTSGKQLRYLFARYHRRVNNKKSEEPIGGLVSGSEFAVVTRSRTRAIASSNHANNMSASTTSEVQTSHQMIVGIPTVISANVCKRMMKS